MHFYFKKDLSKVFLKHLYNSYICFGFKEAILRGCHTAAFYLKNMSMRSLNITNYIGHYFHFLLFSLSLLHDLLDGYKIDKNFEMHCW
jgi:hypothetical protein